MISLRRSTVFAACLWAVGVPVFGAGSAFDLAAPEFAAGALESAEIEQNLLSSAGTWGSESLPFAARHDLAFAFDESRGQGMVFGGRDHLGSVFGDLWLYTPGSGWVMRSPPSGPAARYGHGLVWAGDKFLLFGGFSAGGAALADTWTYDIAADAWSLIATSTAPPARGRFAMAFDPDRRQAVLMGGEDGSGALMLGYTWVFDVAAADWTSLALDPFPPARAGACMAYDRAAGAFVLFGGRATPDTSQLFGDTWVYTPSAGLWEERHPPASPSARSEAAMLYDPEQRQVVLFGGRSGQSSYAGDLVFYDAGRDRWQAFLDAFPPAGRFSHAMAYDAATGVGLVVGGRQDVSSSRLWRYAVSSTGSWTSGVLDAWSGASAVTPVRWTALSAATASLPSGTAVTLQFATSADGSTFDAFRGPDGSTSTFYPSGGPADLWSGHDGARYAKVKVNFDSSDTPARATLASVRVAFNRAPRRILSALPADGTRVNDDTPLFQWALAADADGDAVTYRLEADEDPAFASPVTVASGWSATSFTAAPLASAAWNWRVRGEDAGGLGGEWSPSYALRIDTYTPPGAVTQLAAAWGAENGSIALSWTFPGDDDGALAGGAVFLRRSTAGAILDEAAWLAAAAAESVFPLSAAPGEARLSVVTGLAQGTTYHFAVKTADELGNVSPLSAASPAAMTNAPPSARMLSPNGGEVLSGVAALSWTSADPNAGDALSATLRLSSAPGDGFPILVAAGAPGQTLLWDTRSIPNGSAYKLRTVVQDVRGLSAEDDSDGFFRIDNVNEAPAVTPAWPGGTVSGARAVTWSVVDPNLHDVHVAAVGLSRPGDPAFLPLAAGLTTSQYVLQSRDWPNGAGYRLKVVVTDSGQPALSAAAVSPLFEISNSSAPDAFALIRPLPGDAPSIFDANFEWQRAVDPEGEPVTYALRWALDEAFSQGAAAVTGLLDARYGPPPGSLLFDVTYYWEVEAQDPHGNATRSGVGSFRLERRRAITPDAFLEVRAIAGLPADAYIFFEDAETASPGLLERARLDARGDRLLEAAPYPAWKFGVRTLAGAEVPAEQLVSRVIFRVESAPVAASGPERRHLRPAALNEARGRWELLSPADGGSSTEGLVEGPALVSLVAAGAPSRPLSGVTSFPNPFSPGSEPMRLRYVLTEDAGVTVKVYTLLGDLVKRFDVAKGGPGGTGHPEGFTNELLWDGRNGRGDLVASGVYIAEIRAESDSGSWEEVRRVGVLR